MRRYLSALYGNDRTRAMLGDCVEQGNLPHAMIIEGPSGSGKRTLAKELAAALVCENKSNAAQPLPCHTCRACHLVDTGNATDVHFITREDKASIGIEAVRELRRDVYLSSTEFDARVYIFEDAHTMTPQAQNALLIVLEEPPPGVHFFLLADSAADLLETIRSRARTVRMEKLSESMLENYLSERHPSLASADAAARREAVVMADGRAGELLRLLEPKSKEQMQKSRGITLQLLKAFSGGRYSTLCEAFSSLPTKRDDLMEALSLLSLAVRDLILRKKDETAPLCFFTDSAACESLLSSFRTDKLFSISDALDEAIEKLDKNANTGTVLSLLKADLRSK